MEISNKTLAIVVVLSIVVSLGTMLSFLGTLPKIIQQAPVVGRASDYGNVSLTVQNQLSITLNNDNIVDFGTGYVNTTCLAVVGRDYANMTKIAGGSYYENCWTGTEAGTGFIIENNGNLNASVAVSGATNDTFFQSPVTSYDYGIQVRGETIGGDDGCPNTLNSTWDDLSANKTICRDLLFDTDSTDAVGISISVRVPRDLSSGQYNSSTVEFYAIAS